MDLDPFARWETRPDLVLLLVLVLTVPSFVATLVALVKGRSTRTRTRRPLAHRLRDFLRHLRRKPLEGLGRLIKLASLGLVATFLGLTFVAIYHTLADALLQRPYGTPLALGAIALGSAAAATVALRPRPRALLIGTALGAVVMVVGAFLFTTQTPTASGSEPNRVPGAAETSAPSAPATAAPSAPGTDAPSKPETAAPSESATAAPSTPPSTPPTAVPYTPMRLVLPTGTYRTTLICTTDGSSPVTVVVGRSGVIAASTRAGGVIAIGDVRELRGCDVPRGEERLLFSRDGAPVFQLDGTEWTPGARDALGFLAELTAHDGSTWTWVYKMTEDGLRTGLVESVYLTSN